jgi:outer membrane immunogenic protein
VTGGGAFGEVKESIARAAEAGSFSRGNSGFAAGGGIESRFNAFGLLGPNWTT